VKEPNDAANVMQIDAQYFPNAATAVEQLFPSLSNDDKKATKTINFLSSRLWYCPS